MGKNKQLINLLLGLSLSFGVVFGLTLKEKDEIKTIAENEYIEIFSFTKTAGVSGLNVTHYGETVTYTNGSKNVSITQGNGYALESNVDTHKLAPRLNKDEYSIFWKDNIPFNLKFTISVGAKSSFVTTKDVLVGFVDKDGHLLADNHQNVIVPSGTSFSDKDEIKEFTCYMNFSNRSDAFGIAISHEHEDVLLKYYSGTLKGSLKNIDYTGLYRPLTKQDSINDGDYVVIGNNALIDNQVRVMENKTTFSSISNVKNMVSIGITPNDNGLLNIDIDTNALVFKIEKHQLEDKVIYSFIAMNYFMNNGNDNLLPYLGYLNVTNGTSSSTNYLRIDESNYTYATFEIDITESNTVIKATGKDSYNYVRFNSGASYRYFKAYNGIDSEKSPIIYRLCENIDSIVLSGNLNRKTYVNTEEDLSYQGLTVTGNYIGNNLSYSKDITSSVSFTSDIKPNDQRFINITETVKDIEVQITAEFFDAYSEKTFTSKIKTYIDVVPYEEKVFTRYDSKVITDGYYLVTVFRKSGNNFTVYGMGNTTSDDKVVGSLIGEVQQSYDFTFVNPDTSLVWKIEENDNKYTFKNVENSLYLASNGTVAKAQLISKDNDEFNYRIFNYYTNTTSYNVNAFNFNNEYNENSGVYSTLKGSNTGNSTFSIQGSSSGNAIVLYKLQAPINITGELVKKEYMEGGQFDPTGLSIKYEDSYSHLYPFIDITNNISWNPLEVGTTVTGIWGDREVVINGVTINEYTGVEYTLLNNVDSLFDGQKVIITNNDGSKVMCDTQKSNNRDAVGVMSCTDTTVVPNLGYCEFTIGVVERTDGSIGYTFYDNSNKGNNGYLYAAGSGTNYYLRTQDFVNDNAIFDITIENGLTKIIASYSSNNNLICYNSNLFSCYSSSKTVNTRIYVGLEEATSEQEAKTFMTKYMKLSSISTEESGTGLCISEGWFNNAYDAFKNLTSDGRLAFKNNHIDAYERLQAWGKANGKVIDINDQGELLNKNMNASPLLKDDINHPLIIISVVTLLSVVSIYAFLFIKKKKETR